MQVKKEIFIFIFQDGFDYKKWFLIFSKKKGNEYLSEWITGPYLYSAKFHRSIQTKVLDSIHRVLIYRVKQ